MDINGISLPDPIQHFLKLRAVRVLAAGLFDKPFINPPDGQGLPLAGLVLLRRADAHISNF